ncbi:Spectrin alpha chain [Halotydeus destructor]|nr:Spectrin alpha chain [Halotydeus destructor]
MKSIISADELAKDVAGAEALLERHQEHWGEIDAREDSFRVTAEAGNLLLKQDIAVEDVKDKLALLSAEKASLMDLMGRAKNSVRAVHGLAALLP